MSPSISSIGGRAWKAVTGFGGSLQAPLGLAKDLVTSPFTEDEYEGILGTLVGSVENRFAQVFERSFGPEQGLGAVIGGLPEWARHERIGGAGAGAAGGAIGGAAVGGPVGAVVGAAGGGIYGGVRGSFERVAEDLDVTYRNVIAEPISATALTPQLAAQQDSPAERVGGLFKADNWRQAYSIAQNVTPGQAVALGALETDVTDSQEVNRALGTDWGRAISGTVDAIARLTVDAEVVAGRAALAYRQGRYIRPVNNADDVKAAAFDGKVQAALDEMDGKTAGQIRQEYFPKDPYGAAKADAIARANDFGKPVEAAPRAARTAAVDAEAETVVETLRNRLAGDEARLDPESGQVWLEVNEVSEEFYQHIQKWKRGRDVPPETQAAMSRLVEAAPDGAPALARGVGGGAEPNAAQLSTGAAVDFNALSAGDEFTLGLSSWSSDVGVARRGGKTILRLEDGGKAAPLPGESEWITQGRFRVSHIEDGKFSGEWQVFLERLDDAAETAQTVGREGQRELIRDLTLRGLLGDTDAIARLYDEGDARVAGIVDRISGEQALANQIKRQWDELPKSLTDELEPRVKAEVEQLYGEASSINRILEDLGERGGQMRDLRFASPQAAAERAVKTKARNLEQSLAQSEFFQESVFAAPLRWVHKNADPRLRPETFVGFHDPNADVTLMRMMREANIDADDIDSFRTRYIEAPSPGEKSIVWDTAVERTVRQYAERAGITGDELRRVVDESMRRHRKTHSALDDARRYDAEGAGVIEKVMDDGEVMKVQLPPTISQEANFGVVPNQNVLEQAVRRVKKHKDKYGDLPDDILGSDLRRVPTDVMEGFYRAWKPAVLLRVGWPMRVVGDEQLRVMAKIGALNDMWEVTQAAGRWTMDAFRAAKRLPQDVFEFRRAAVEAGEQVPGKLQAARQSWIESKDSFGLRWYDVQGNRFEAARGIPQERRNIQQALIDKTTNAQGRMLYGAEQKFLDELQQATKGWRTVQPDSQDWARSWEHAVNKQLASDPVTRRMLEGWDTERVVRWLRDTDEGQAYFRRSPLYRPAQRHAGQSVEESVAMQKQMVDRLTLGEPELAAKAAKGSASVDDVRRLQPDQGRWPAVHGQIVEEVAGGTALGRLWNGIIEKTFDILGSQPTIALARNRLFDHVYKAEVSRLVSLSDDAALSKSAINEIQGKARSVALQEVKDVLFDLAQESSLAHTLRFASPFFMAQQEIITRWAGLAAHNPAFVARMHQVWQSPEKAGLVVDENGARIGADGSATLPATGESVEPGEDRYVTLPLPEWAEDWPGSELFDNARFNKEGLNIAMQMTDAVGTGPIVQVPVNEIVKDRPELEDSVSFMLPYGATQNTVDLMLPAVWRRLRTRSQGEDADEYRNSMIRIYYDEVTKFNLGEREDRPTFEEAKRKANEFWNMRTVANFIMPVAPWFTSPYQMHIDAYRNAQDRYREDEQALGGKTPDEWFLDEYGEEYFALTQSVTDSVDGVPPTVEGFTTRKKYQDLIEQHPELGSLIVGKEGAGEFSRSVYEHQKDTPVRPGAEEMQREGKSFEEAQAEPDVRLGWMKFSRKMDLIEAEMFARGLPNLQVKEAQDLAAMKRMIIDDIATNHPQWYQEYVNFDPLKQQRKLAGMRKIVQDDQLRKRPEIQGLAEYLDLRDAFVAELSARSAAGGASTLQSQANQDLRVMWETLVNQISERNMAFGNLRNRWLASDLPAASDASSPVDFGQTVEEVAA